MTGGFPGSGGIPGTGGSIPAGNCCVAGMRDTAGCEDPDVQACVCSFDGFCCEQAWDQACVDEADRFCGANCSGATGGAPGTGGMMGVGGGVTGGAGGMPGTGGAFAGDCCETHDGRGCQEPSVQACVCSFDPFCCETTWDELCANEAQSDCNANCMTGSGGAPPTGGAPGSGGLMGSGGVVEQCTQLFNDDCGQCLCSSCFDQLNTCLGDLGCLSILACIERTGCNGFNCYQPGTCQEVIDTFGGLTGSSTQNALGLGTCAASSGCSCF